jgi:hypothetical protein
MKKLGFLIMRKVTFKWFHDLMVKRITKRIGKQQLKNGPSLFVDEKQSTKHISALSNQGCTVLDHKLTDTRINEIIRFSETIKAYDPYHNSETPVDIKNPSRETHIAHFKRSDLAKKDLILDIANDPGVLNIVQEFLGAKPTITNINLWWSFGNKEKAEHAQLFHRDLDDWKFCKLFIYLTDVDHTAGPHVYVKNSSQSTKFRKIKRYSDTEIENAFGKENVVKFIDTKGASFLVDTYGFHKGLLPESKDRLLLQVQYSLNPIGIEEYEPVKTDRSDLDRYINRLIISA